MYVSSPKNHAQPVGLFVDSLVNETVSGSVPEVGVEALKLAFGGSTAATGTTVTMMKKMKNNKKAENFFIFHHPHTS